MVLHKKPRRYTKRMEDPKKVAKVKKDLIKDTGIQDWDDVIGLFMMPLVTYNNSTETYDLDNQKGMTVKAFTSTSTGELRFYWIGKLKK